MPITSAELRNKYLEFFESHGHVRLPSAPLIPENDPSVLFTTAGMHPLVPYLKGQPHPAGSRLTDVQKCLRTTDIESVGDATHATVFEMLGNWSLGDYFKDEAIRMSWEFLTSPQWLGIDPRKLAVSVFAGDEQTPADEEAAAIWQNQGLPTERIAHLGKEDNWWPAGGKTPGPQGPDTEMFYWVGQTAPPAQFDPSDKRWVEIWNDVFMQYNRTPDGQYENLPKKNVDTGMGLERVVMVLNGLASIYEIDTFEPLVALIKTHTTNNVPPHDRVVADHIKAATFIMGDEHPVVPSKTEQGYVLRRVIRRALRSARVLGLRNTEEVFRQGMEIVTHQYASVYPSLSRNLAAAQTAMAKEINQFGRVLERGLQQFELVHAAHTRTDRTISGPETFRLYETFGFPLELTLELAQEQGLTVDTAGFETALKQHQDQSRQAAAGRFAGGLADHSRQSVRYHTATHLLHQALRTVLGQHVEQRGSNINPERLRFDFSHPDKLTPEQLEQVAALVNQKIREDWPVTREEMTVEQARSQGALGLFEHKYGDKVSVYSIGDFSREICGGPHVEKTGELGAFKILKQESVSAGIRRIKAELVLK